MEVEVISLAHSCREMLLIIDMVTSLCDAIGLPKNLTTMDVPVHEDNAGALILAQTLPPQFIPQSKHYDIKTICFHEEIVKRGITLVKIDTGEQLVELFTKALPRVTLKYLISKLMC